MSPDPAKSAYAWARFRRLMRLLMAVTVLLVVAALRLAAGHAGSASIGRLVVAALIAGAGMLAGSAVMGFSFLARHRRWGEGGNPPPAGRRPDAPE